MPMKNPPHPGRIVRQECLEPLGLSVTDGAKALGVSRNALSELINERRGISPEMAIRLSKAFGSSPEVWAGLQLDFDMAQAEKNKNGKTGCLLRLSGGVERGARDVTVLVPSKAGGRANPGSGLRHPLIFEQGRAAF